PEHRDLRRLRHGIDLAGESGHDQLRDTSHDAWGHGSHTAGIIAGMGADTTAEGLTVAGFAPDAELHVCRGFPGGRGSTLIRALGYCMEHGIDLIGIGAGATEGSLILERHILLAKEHGIACIAAAGNSGGPVDYPAASPHVLAVAAIGQAGTYRPDSVGALLSLDGEEG